MFSTCLSSSGFEQDKIVLHESFYRVLRGDLFALTRFVGGNGQDVVGVQLKEMMALCGVEELGIAANAEPLAVAEMPCGE